MPSVTTAPIPTQISIAPTVVTNSPQTNQGSDNQSTAADWWQVGLSAVMAIATVVLVVIAGRQFKQQAADTAAALRHAKEANEATTKALQMTERPRLVVRHVVADGIDTGGHIGPVLTNAAVIVTNNGVFPATLLKVYRDWLFSSGLPIRNPALNYIDETSRPSELLPAAFVHIPLPDLELTTDQYMVLNNQVHGTPTEHQGNLYVLGYLKYTDAVGLRRTYFCFKYDTALHYFTPVEHPGYNYED